VAIGAYGVAQAKAVRLGALGVEHDASVLAGGVCHEENKKELLLARKSAMGWPSFA